MKHMNLKLGRVVVVMKDINLRLACIYAVIGLAVMGCKPASEQDPAANTLPPDNAEIFLGYAGLGTSSEEGALKVTMCQLTGTSETLVLARLTADPVFVGRDPSCSVIEPYRGSYWEMDFESLRTAGKDEVMGRFTALVMVEFNPELVEARAGQHMLLSIRVSDGLPFLIRYQNVELRDAASDPLAAATDLPSAWSDVIVAADDVQRNHATKCLELVDQGPGGCRDMTDAEFDVWIHDPVPKPCAQPTPPQAVDPDLGTIVNDNPD